MALPENWRIKMDNKVLNDIKTYAANRLNQAYGFVGVADAPDFASLNSGNDDMDISIEIKATSSQE